MAKRQKKTQLKEQVKQETEVKSQVEQTQQENPQELQQESQPTQPAQESQQEQPVVETEEELDSPTQLDNKQGKKNKEKMENLQNQLKTGSSLLSSDGQKPNVYRLRDYLVMQSNPAKELKKLVANGTVDETLNRAIKIEMQRLGHMID